MADTFESEDLEENAPAGGAVPASAASASSSSASTVSISAQEEDQKDKEETFISIANFLKKYTAATVGNERPDVLNDRYVLRPREKLPAFSGDFATACEAVDEGDPDRKVYAIMFKRDIPYRLSSLDAQANITHPNLLQLHAHGVVRLADDDQNCYVAIVERPAGRSLRQILESRKTPFQEQFLIEDIVAPICQVLRELEGQGVCHGSLNLDTVFFSDKVQVGESFSHPASYTQKYHFETTERAQANPLGKGEGSIGIDIYALGILIAHMMHGIRHFERMDRKSYQQRRLMLGSYNTLLNGHESSTFSDFFKGALHDNPEDRWRLGQVEEWIGGKKFNLLAPSLLREAQRPFPFMGEEFFNRRALADAFALNWEEAQISLRSGYLSRWVEVSLHRNEMANILRKIMERLGGINSANEKANNELVARSIAILDPEGPIRMKGISCFTDGLGPVLANGFRMREQSLIQGVVTILDYNAFTQVNEGATDNASKRLLMLQKRFSSCSKYLRMQAMGFGMERLLYELNPTLPCQSPLLMKDTVLDLSDLLEAIDKLGARKSKGFDYLDRHIAAFVAAKMDISREVTLSDSRMLPALSQNPQILILYMLSQAQKRVGKPKMKGLSAWAALRVLPLVDNFHGRSIRHKVRVGLKSAAMSGDLERILNVLMDKEQVKADANGYQQAIANFSRNQTKIEKLQNRDRMIRESRRIGMLLASIVGYSMLAISIASLLKGHFF